MKTLSEFHFVVNQRGRNLFSLGIVILGVWLMVPATFAEVVSDAQISESVSVYIPDAGNSMLLVRGMPAQVLAIDGDNAVISLTLKNGFSVQAQIPVKYLKILPQKQALFTGTDVAKPTPTAAPTPDTTKVSVSIPARKTGTFNIDEIHVHDQVENISDGIMMDDPTSTSIPKAKVFSPQVEVKVSVSHDALSKNLIARAYYYDSSEHLIQTFAQPSVAEHQVTDGVRSGSVASIWPTVVPANKSQSIYFPLPDKLPDSWSLVVVFGNSKGAVAASVPDDQVQSLNYPEHDLVAKTLLSPDVEITDTDQMPSLIEEVVQSDNPRYPAFTLLMHLPHGVTDPKDVSGVLATCIIADSVGEIRDKLNAIKPQNDPNPYFAFAEAHNMAVIAWGARWVWSSYANFDELDKNQIRGWDDDFQSLADAWDRGIQMLVDRYGIPDHDYLMYGFCAGGEWVHRLALHKPDRFLAVQMHISTSYDAPTPDAKHVMWLLTTGELDSGCDRARRFYSTARDAGYPIIFKAIMGLGHADSPLADQLGIRFFNYALAVKTKRDASDVNDLIKSQPLDLSGFYTSPFYGDLMNQEMFAAQEKEMIPPGFLVPLPTKDIAEAWNK